MTSRYLLAVDAVINLVLGVALTVFPAGLVEFLGVPGAEPAFYPAILGAVLFGIGCALLIEAWRGSSGLGLWGAISINLCGAAVLAGWLVFGGLALPLRGRVLLWSLVLLLAGISAVEAVAARDRA